VKWGCYDLLSDKVVLRISLCPASTQKDGQRLEFLWPSLGKRNSSSYGLTWELWARNHEQKVYILFLIPELPKRSNRVFFWAMGVGSLTDSFHHLQQSSCRSWKRITLIPSLLKPSLSLFSDCSASLRVKLWMAMILRVWSADRPQHHLGLAESVNSRAPSITFQARICIYQDSQMIFRYTYKSSKRLSSLSSFTVCRCQTSLLCHPFSMYPIAIMYNTMFKHGKIEINKALSLSNSCLMWK
jgi:hypothetical protein